MERGHSFSIGPLNDFEGFLLPDLGPARKGGQERDISCSERTVLAPGPVVLNLGDFVPREHVAGSGDTFGGHSWGEGVTGVQWVKAREAVKHCALCRTAPTTG